MEENLPELYRQYGEIILKMEILQQRYVELRTKILQELERLNKK